MWEIYKEDFDTFTIEIFKICHQMTIRKLRSHLRRNGVWVKVDRHTTVAQSLYATLQEDEPIEWTETEMKEQLDKDGFNSYQAKRLRSQRSTSPQPQPQSQRPTSLSSSLSSSLSLPPSNLQQSTSPPQQTPFQQTPLQQTPPSQPQEPQLSSTTASTTSGFGKELANLAKLYTDENKYSGENDNFDFKLVIFNDLCNRADVPQAAMVKAYPTMLRGLALDHYYTNLRDIAQTLLFDQICDTTRNYFEGPEYRRGILGQWNSMTLKSMIGKTENTGKSTLDCLQLLIKELRHLQHGLDPDLRTDKFLHNKLINACQELPACQYACFKPSDSLAGLINDLRSSIITFEKSNNENSQAFFTDRRYHRQYPRSSSSRPFNRHQSPSQHITTKKRCFVCNREGCWSSKHSQDERDESRKRFREKLNRRFDRNARQYIAEYEGTDNELDSESIDDMIEALVIDVHSLPGSPTQAQTESFLTSFGTIQYKGAIDTTTNLADRSFTHAITSINPTTTHSDVDPFAYITSNRYTSNEFYGVMIDTGASKRSTAGYGQYLAYKRIRDVAIDNTRAGAINVQFGIGSTSSIGSIIVDTPVGSVEFHVVQADTPFLLCLADMDILQVYYNNLSNTLVTPTKSVPVVRRFGHPFLLWEESLQSFIVHSFDQNPCYLTNTELRRLHRRFGHPSADRLHRVLERSSYNNINKQTIDYLTRYCSYCRRLGKSLGRFKFIL